MQGMIGESFMLYNILCTQKNMFNISITFVLNSSVSGKTEEGETEESLHVSKNNLSKISILSLCV